MASEQSTAGSLAKNTKLYFSYFKKLLKKTSIQRQEGAHLAKSDGLHETIAARAHALYEARGHRHGCDLQDWLDAEREMLNRHYSV